jgi:thiamine-phosphate pyrophosphorylase
MDRLIVLSHSKKVEDEVKVITSLFENGLQTFHLRKPDYSMRDMRKLIHSIPEKYWNRIIVHSHYELALKMNLKGVHVNKRKRKSKILTGIKLFLLRIRKPGLQISTSFSNLSNLFEDTNNYSYVFLSPVFDSISQSGYQGAFSHHNLKIAMDKTKHFVLALGGIKPENIETAKQMGFSGVVLSGYIWESPNPIEAFLTAKKVFQSLS